MVDTCCSEILNTQDHDLLCILIELKHTVLNYNISLTWALCFSSYSRPQSLQHPRWPAGPHLFPRMPQATLRPRTCPLSTHTLTHTRRSTRDWCRPAGKCAALQTDGPSSSTTTPRPPHGYSWHTHSTHSFI